MSLQLVNQIKKNGTIHKEAINVASKFSNGDYGQYFTRWTNSRFDEFHKPCNQNNRSEEAQLAFSKEMTDAVDMMTRQVALGKAYHLDMEHLR